MIVVLILTFIEIIPFGMVKLTCPFVAFSVVTSVSSNVTIKQTIFKLYRLTRSLNWLSKRST